jgi:hypothetical protein
MLLINTPCIGCNDAVTFMYLMEELTVLEIDHYFH